MTDLAHDTAPAAIEVAAPTQRLLAASLLLAPIAYLAVDCCYVVRGWDDGPTAAMHVLAAALYGLAAIKLVSLTRGRTQAVLMAVAVLGIVGNAGVGDNTLHIALGGNDLFDEQGPANVFKTMGFFFPLTFVIAAVALQRGAALRGGRPSWLWAQSCSRLPTSPTSPGSRSPTASSCSPPSARPCESCEGEACP